MRVSDARVGQQVEHVKTFRIRYTLLTYPGPAEQRCECGGTISPGDLCAERVEPLFDTLARSSAPGGYAYFCRCLACVEPVEQPGDYRQARGVGSWQFGDELPEDRIRRMRDTERGGEGDGQGLTATSGVTRAAGVGTVQAAPSARQSAVQTACGKVAGMGERVVHCETCGSPVVAESSDGGTCSYRPLGEEPMGDAMPTRKIAGEWMPTERLVEMRAEVETLRAQLAAARAECDRRAVLLAFRCGYLDAGDAPRFLRNEMPIGAVVRVVAGQGRAIIQRAKEASGEQ